MKTLREYKVTNQDKFDKWFDTTEFIYGKFTKDECYYKGVNIMLNDDIYYSNLDVLKECIERVYTNETIGKILENGNIEKEYHGQGFIYKNFEAFESKSDKICYVAELDEDNTGNTYKDFLQLAEEFMQDEAVKEYCEDEGITAEYIALDLFESVDWQEPSTLITDWENSGAYTE